MNYTKIEHIGGGGFGQVYRAIDENNNFFALKELDLARYSADLALAENIAKRFAQEATKQSEIIHENVIKVIDSNLAGNPPFFVMELGEHTFTKSIERYRKHNDNFDEIKTGLFHVLSGLSAIHEVGIWHRDLKPQNILFVRPNKFAISDFGLIAVRNTDATTLTMTGTTAGTESYSPPEFMRDFKKASAASDIYSFGAILHDIFVGRNRVPYSELKDGTAKLGEVISKCTKSKTYDRYRNIEDLRSDLFDAILEFELVGTSSAAVPKSALFFHTPLSEADCDELIELIDDTPKENKTEILKLINPNFIEQAYSASENAANYIGEQFAQHVISSSFDFNFCDILADRLSNFFQFGSIATKSLCLLALLQLGTSHNRWYVERKFIHLAGPTCTQSVIQRLLIDAKTHEINLHSKFYALSKSISVTETQLHPLLAPLFTTK